jgi:hypothetical protein
MLRFIFVCMFLVAASILTLSAQFMLDGIKTARQGVLARNNPAMESTPVAIEATGPSFKEIYANAPTAPDVAINETMSPEDLNAISTAAGGNDSFGGGFTDQAPAALAEEELALPSAPSEEKNSAAN